MLKKLIGILILTNTLFMTMLVSAATIDLTNVDKAVIKYHLNDGTIKQAEQVNRNNGKFEEAILNLLDYLANTANVKDIISINDTPIEDTQFIKYSKPIEVEIKGIGYSNSKDIIAINNFNTSVNLTPSNPVIGGRNDATIPQSGTIYSIKVVYNQKVLYLPLSQVLKSIGYIVNTDFNDYYQYLTATRAGSLIEIKSSETFALVDGSKVILGNAGIYSATNKDMYVTLEDAKKITGCIITYNPSEGSAKYEKIGGAK